MITLSEAAAENAVGMKASNLALLIRAGFPVPPGFILTADATDGDNRSLEQWVSDARFRQEAAAAFEQIAPPAVVRSSCAAEDLKEASFAGQYETVLNVTAQNLWESILRCLASKNDRHVQSYLTQRLGAVAREQAISIIVQELIDADAAGVIFSHNPVTGNRDEIMINASFGLGVAVVSGLVTPDLFIVSRQTGAIVQKELGHKDSKVVLDREGTRIVETTRETRERFSIRDEQLNELVRMTIAIETLLGYPVDLEFAYRQGKLYILQARPITA